MRREASGKGKEAMPSKMSKPAILSAEAAAMEQKLAELRKAMEKERAKREALMANVGGGSIWRNGSANNAIRTNIKGKGPGEPAAASAAGSSASGRRPASSENSPAPSVAPGPSGALAGPAAASRSASTRASPAAEASVSGNRIAAPRADPPAALRASKGQNGRPSSSGARDGGGGVMSCGTDDGPVLADGAFNEGDSHKSFLEALNEWRRANRGEPTQAAATDDGSSQGADAAGAPAGGRPRRASYNSPTTLEVQTETRSVSRPTSAKPLSYFDKLVLNTSSRQAGHLAAGGPPGLQRSLSTGQAGSLWRPSTDGSAPAQPAAAPLATQRSGSAAQTLPPHPPAVSAPKSSTVSGSDISWGDAAAMAPGLNTKSEGGAVSDPLSILDRLEALERQRQADDELDDELESGTAPVSHVIQVSTVNGLVLTKGVRLPDEVLMPTADVEC